MAKTNPDYLARLVRYAFWRFTVASSGAAADRWFAAFDLGMRRQRLIGATIR